MGPTAALLPGDRLHLQHGPIDLIIGVDGDRDGAFRAARTRFDTLLGELVEELDVLRQSHPHSRPPDGETARRMVAATGPLARFGYLTPMAAVAGSVAEEVLVAMVQAAPLKRAYVNNGGDIAIHLSQGQSYRTAICGADGYALGQIALDASNPVRGIATSGRHGRSLSLGIADSVTVLARTASMADAAATVIANAVDLPDHPAIARRPAHHVVDDSDLGQLPVVVDVPSLTRRECNAALAKGRDRAEELLRDGLVEGAALFLQDEVEVIGTSALTLTKRTPAHA